MLAQQAEIIFKEKRNHTALAVWCGGNELQDEEGNPLDNNDPVLRTLWEQMRKWDSRRKWLPTSPSGGVFLNSMENIRNSPERLYDVHGPWEHQGLEKHCLLYNSGTSLLHTEFGVEGMTSYSTLRRVTAEENLLPASKDNEIYFHRGAWWNNEPLVQESFGGRLSDVEHIRKGSQYLQYEGLKYAVESNRRRAFRNSGTFPWQLNEPYPNLYCTSAVDYYGIPKPAYYGMKKVYGQYRVNAAFASPLLKGCEKLRVTVYAGACGEEGEQDLQIWSAIYDEKGQECREEVYSVSELGARDCKVADLAQDISCCEGELLLLRLRLLQGRKVLAENEYLFTRGHDFHRVFAGEAKAIETEIMEDKVYVRNNSAAPLWFVYLTNEEHPLECYFAQNYFCLMPGEERSVSIAGHMDGIGVQALNAAYRIEKKPMEGGSVCR